MAASAKVLHNQEVVLGEHHDDRNIHFREDQRDVKDREVHHHTRSLARSNKLSSAVCSNLNPVRGVSMQSL